jgi:hypothetical protein
MAVDKMLDLLPPLDVSDHRAFITATVILFLNYPDQVFMMAATDPVNGVPGKTDRPTIRIIKEVLDKLNDPYQRETERLIAQESAARLRMLAPPRAKRTEEEQVRVDQQIAEMRQSLGIPNGVQRRGAYLTEKQNDGKHALRIASDLLARKARNEQRSGGASA